MKAIGYYVIVEKIKEEPKKVGGLSLTEVQNKDIRYSKGKIITKGELVPDSVVLQSVCWYDKAAGYSIQYVDEKIYQVLRYDRGDIVLIE